MELEISMVRDWSKFFSIGVGILSIIFAIAVIVFPEIGLVVAGILIGIALLITSFQIISEGISGHRGARQTNVGI